MSYIDRTQGLAKTLRARALCRRSGMRRIRVWVPDSTAPGFAQEAERQATVLRNAPEEQDALSFIEALSADWDDASV